MTTGEKIKALRIQHGLTQEELGAKVGVSKVSIHKYETNTVTGLKRTTLAALCEVLDCTPSYLMGWEPEPATVAAIGGTGHDTISQVVEMIKPLTDEEEELLRIYRSLPVRARLQFLSQAYAFEDGAQ